MSPFATMFLIADCCRLQPVELKSENTLPLLDCPLPQRRHAPWKLLGMQHFLDVGPGFENRSYCPYSRPKNTGNINYFTYTINSQTTFDTCHLTWLLKFCNKRWNCSKQAISPFIAILSTLYQYKSFSCLDWWNCLSDDCKADSSWKVMWSNGLYH